MTTETIIKLVIESAAVIIPSTITILTLLRKQLYKHTIDAISSRIQTMVVSNEENLKLIHTELNIHNQAITSYMQMKQAGQKIREITKHALEVTTNAELKKILTKFTQQMVIFVRQVLDVGFQNIGKEQLMAKFDVAIDNINHYSELIMKPKNLENWKVLVKPHIDRYKKDILQVFADKVNNKNNRFLIKSLDTTHNVVKQFVLYYIELEQSQQE